MAITINRTTSLDGAILPEYMPGLLYMNENQAHQFVITCTSGGSAVTLTGGITGRFMRADGQTILLSGSISSGKANLTLPQSCYIVPGRFTMAIFNVVSNAVTTIYALTGNVARTQTDTLVDPGNTVPTIDNLLAEIDAMRQATADAEAAATKAVRYDTTQSLTDANKSTARGNIDAAGLAQVVRHDAAQNLTETQKTTARGNIDAAGLAQVVRHDASQNLTETQKTTARGNIDAAGLAQVVRHDASQNLTETQKTTARGNIDAANNDDVVGLESSLGYGFAVGDLLVPLFSSTNRLDTSELVQGKYLLYTNGDEMPQSSYCYTKKYIPVDYPGGRYIGGNVGGGCQVCFYDLGLNYIGGASLDTDNPFTAPENAIFMRISFLSANSNTAYIAPLDINNGIRENYGFIGYKRYIDFLPDIAGATEPTVINTNWFDTTNIVEGRYLNYQTGMTAANPSYCYTHNYIPIMSGVYIYSSGFGSSAQFCFYDENKEFIRGIIFNNNGFNRTPDNAKYMRCSCVSSNKDTAYIIVHGHKMEKTEYLPGRYRANIRNRPYRYIVGLDAVCDYHSISEAVEAANSGDIIYVKPGIYEDEAISAFGKDITIIGEDPLTTVVVNEYNTYSLPPIEASCGSIKGITFYAKYTGAESQDASGWKPYAAHIDNDGLYENTLSFENCVFIAEQNYAVGIGLRKGELIFQNCKFVSETHAPFYFHDAVSTSKAGDEYLTVKDCYGIAKSTGTVMRIDSQKTEGATVYPVFINSIFVSDITDTPVISATNTDSSGGTATTVGTFMDLINFYQSKQSRHNYPQSLDYQV